MKALFLGNFAAAVAPLILSKVETPLETEILKNEGDAERLARCRPQPKSLSVTSGVPVSHRRHGCACYSRPRGDLT